MEKQTKWALQETTFRTEDYDYPLPPELIAQVPVWKRDHSRLLVVDCLGGGDFVEKHFFEIPDLLRPGDVLVVNDSKVIPARIYGRKETGGRVELLVLDHPGTHMEGPGVRLCMFQASRAPKQGTRLILGEAVTGKVKEVLGGGLVRIAFHGNGAVDRLIENAGHPPLPPYIKRGEMHPFEALDKERYQTVYAKKRGSVAAPTAGLHFTENLLASLREGGIQVVSVTLDVGYGTFQPVKVDDIRDHFLAEEVYGIEPGAAETINKTRRAGGRVIAVGTTAVRTLETASDTDGTIRPGVGKTDLLITPGFSFKVIDGLITNFHLPKSSLMFLVAALAGFERIQEAYRYAVRKRFRFYSYGDAMLIL